MEADKKDRVKLSTFPVDRRAEISPYWNCCSFLPHRSFGGFHGTIYNCIDTDRHFLVLICLGIVAVKTGILEERSLGNVSKLVMRMALPAYLFINTAEGATRAGLAQSLLVLPLAGALYVVLFLLSLVMEKGFRLKGNRGRVFRAIAMFGNVGFMGIPLVVELYPDTALLYISLFSILDQVLFWTYGVSMTYPVAEQGAPRQKGSLKSLLSPALIAILAGTVFVLLDLHLPYVFTQALTKLGSASMPLSLLYIGGLLAMTDVRQGLKCKEIYVEIVVKMLLLPLVYFFVMSRLGVPTDMAGTLTFMAGLPAINMVAMLSKSNGSDGTYAVCAVMLTTVASLVTLPLLSLGMSLMG